MTDTIAKGHCLCNEVKFTTRGEPMWVAYCHCESCRRHTGAPVTCYVGFRREQVTFAADPPFFESSKGVRRRFCSRCGTPVSYEADDCPGELHLHISGFDQPELFQPTRHVLHSEHLPWFDTRDGLPRRG